MHLTVSRLTTLLSATVGVCSFAAMSAPAAAATLPKAAVRRRL